MQASRTQVPSLDRYILARDINCGTEQIFPTPIRSFLRDFCSSVLLIRLYSRNHGILGTHAYKSWHWHRLDLDSSRTQTPHSNTIPHTFLTIKCDLQSYLSCLD